MPKTEKNIPDDKECDRIKKILLVLLGILSLVLGGIGVFLPLLPTTPFVLLAAACFAGSSPEMHKRLSNSPFFGEYIENYRTNSGVRRSVKIRALVFLWFGLGMSAALVRQPRIWVVLAVVGICVSTHLLMLKTKNETEETC